MDYIYLLKNGETGRIYVGRTSYPEKRLQMHMSALKGNRHDNELMQADFNEYGESSFDFEIVEERESLSRSGLEGAWMLKLKTYDKEYGYNYKDPFAWSNKGFSTKNIPESEMVEKPLKSDYKQILKMLEEIKDNQKALSYLKKFIKEFIKTFC